mmetsp:Transcript_3922/g.11363  ORF Transcript_3922/g.11363 Transcript_3922/m.11363 type:complete len:312 (+) Transcript_3922:307-1242(+)
MHATAALRELEVVSGAAHGARVKVPGVLAHGAADHHAAPRRNVPKQVVEDFASDTVEDEVNAVRTKLSNLLTDIASLVVHGAVELQRLGQEFALDRTASHTHNARARALRELHRDGAHSAGGRRDDNGLAALRRLSYAENADVGCEARGNAEQPQRRALAQPERRHHGRHAGGGHPRHGLRAEHAGDGGADAGAAWAGGEHRAVAQRGQHRAELDGAVVGLLVEHGAHEGVDAEGLHPHHDLALGDVLQAHGLHHALTAGVRVENSIRTLLQHPLNVGLLLAGASAGGGRRGDHVVHDGVVRVGVRIGMGS